MATPITTWKQTKYLTSLAIYGGTPGSTGSITWSSAVDLALAAGSGTGTFEAYTLNLQQNQVSIRPADSTIENMVNEYQTFDAQVREVAPLIGIGNLKTLAATYSHIKVIAQYKITGATNINCEAFIGVIESSDTTFQQGKNVDSLSIKPAGYAAYQGLFASLPGTFS